MREFYKFVGENFKVSAEVKERKLRKSILNIYHRKDGSLSEFRIRDMGYGTERSNSRYKTIPTLDSCTVDNKPVRVEYSLPITIQTD
jgi:hypothetical protein